MRRHYLLAAVFGLVLAATPAHAHITITEGAEPAGGVDNILFNGAGTVTSGTTVTGRTNSSPSYLVDFTGAESLVADASGQASITSADSNGFNYLKINLQDSLYAYTRFAFTVFKGDGPLKIRVNEVPSQNPVVEGTFALDKNSEKFYVEATGGQLITSIELFGNILEVGDFRQPRIGGISPVPEPGFYGALALGLSGLLGLRYRSRRTA